jgi:hypothetical protein
LICSSLEKKSIRYGREWLVTAIKMMLDLKRKGSNGLENEVVTR